MTTEPATSFAALCPRWLSPAGKRLALIPLAAGALLVTSMAMGASPAAADFRLCNKTKSRVGVALGYKDGETWVTEGWWNIPANTCETLLRGSLVARFYYVYAIDYDHGGEWGGKAFMCTREKEFTIRGIDDCLARGFDRTGFFEIDTGEQQSWTVQLTEPGSDAAAAATPRPGQPGSPLPFPSLQAGNTTR